MTRPRITVVGSTNLDLVATAEKLPVAGETVTGATFAQHPGGKGANQALAACRLGADVSMIARTGEGPNRDAALALLKADGVDLSGIVSDPEEQTGVALIAVDKAGENQIVVASGANGNLSPDNVKIEGAPDAILCQLEVPTACVLAAMRTKSGLFAVNLAPAAPVPVELLETADLLIVNEGEAAFYGDGIHRGEGMVALTLGGQGAVLYRAGKEIARTQAFTVPVIDTTGAGDTFCAALVLALAEGCEEGEALRFASAASALAVTKPGAQPSLPWREEVDAFLEDQD
ncbi:MAG TPA: ribokinase [Henriciella marina]|uniref:ribokinase n=1 Tax=Henriciella sp. TaxID=1968823 RepID=UPI00181877E9|nr:ribokinase [Henriciella sp.]HIG23301.1 ribokinase [Henriciella sp.]HIK66068.1 ribokinase [Henriciella marina]